MSRSAGITWRTKAGAAAMLLPVLAPISLLAACGSAHEQEMTDKLAAAQDAANKAVTAQHAAEKAAANAASAQPAPTQEAPTLSDLSDDNTQDLTPHDDAANNGSQTSPGGDGQAVAQEGPGVAGHSL